MSNFYPFIHINKAVVQPLFIPAFSKRRITADILRLDQIHPVVSGNKWFKLKYHLQDALKKKYKTILTFGGAWSNHIIATAFVSQKIGLQSIGIIRGEEPAQLSHTLLAAKECGMKLEFLNRAAFAEIRNKDFLSDILKISSETYVIKEGGSGALGIKGSSEILSLTEKKKYSHIMCSIGSGTMYSGLLNSSAPEQQIIGICIFKGMQIEPEQHDGMSKQSQKNQHCKIIDNYHFGGYARKDASLIHFMNQFFIETGIPTDFVYTGKLLFACLDLVKKDYFGPGSHMLIIHSGGLQGNASLPPGALLF